MPGRLFEMQLLEEGIITNDNAADLATGQTISAADYSPPTGLTAQGSATVSGGMSTQKLRADAVGLYVVPYVLTLASPTGVFPDYCYIRVSAAPAAS